MNNKTKTSPPADPNNNNKALQNNNKAEIPRLGSLKHSSTVQSSRRPTFEVDRSVSVVVGLLDDGVDLAAGHVFAHQLDHGLPQLLRGDLPVAVHVELHRDAGVNEWRRKTPYGLMSSVDEVGS